MEIFSALLAFLCMWGIHRSPVNSPHKGQWRGALMLFLIFAWIHGWVNSVEAGDLRRLLAHYGVTIMCWTIFTSVNEGQFHKRFLFAIQIRMKISPCNSVHQIASVFCIQRDSTSVVYVQNFVAITLLESKWEQNEIFIEFGSLLIHC